MRAAQNVTKANAVLRRDPNASARRIAKEHGPKRQSVLDIIKKDLGGKCFTTVAHQRITEAKATKRAEKRINMLKPVKNAALGVRKIYFPDEKLFNVGNAARKCAQNYRVWGDAAQKKKELAQADVIRGEKHGGISVVASSGVCSEGVGALRFIERGVKIDQFVYLDVVKNVYRPDMEIMLGPGNYVFTQDGPPSHTAKSVIQWIKGNKIKLLEDWPANSPDLNPMDYGNWGMIEPKVYELKPTTEVELKCAIRKVVAELSPTVVEKTAAQFQKRLELCAQNEGNQFEYKM